MMAARSYMAVLLQCFGKQTSGEFLSRGLGAQLRRTQIGTTALLFSQQRSYGKVGNYIHVERDSENREVAVVEMRRKPVNCMNTDFMVELDETLKIVENDQSYRGIILTSGNPDVFCAGLDIPNMYQKTSKSHFSDMWRSVINFWTRIYGTRLVTIAAINGHAPAGGCMTAVSCDYRIMAQGNYEIGISGARLGLYVPFWLREVMSKSCGQRTAAMSVEMGLLYNPDKALAIGLVDEVVQPSELLNTARKRMSNWLQVPDHARVMTKAMLRASLLERIHSEQEEEVASTADYLRSETVQKSIAAYLELLKN